MNTDAGEGAARPIVLKARRSANEKEGYSLPHPPTRSVTAKVINKAFLPLKVLTTLKEVLRITNMLLDLQELSYDKVTHGLTPRSFKVLV